MAAEMIPELGELLPMVSIEFGHDGDNVLIVHDVATNPVSGAYIGMLFGMLEQVGGTDALGLQFDFKLSGSGTWKDLMYADSWNDVGGSGGLFMNLTISEEGRTFATEMFRAMVPDEVFVQNNTTREDTISFLQQMNGVP